MEVATQCPPYTVPGSKVGLVHLGAALQLLFWKSHTYQFSLAEKYSEGNLVWTGGGQSLVLKPPAPWALQPGSTLGTGQPLTWRIVAWA